ncbi:MAG: C25 family cysteine peptidase [Anaerolineae bacterium]
MKRFGLLIVLVVMVMAGCNPSPSTPTVIGDPAGQIWYVEAAQEGAVWLPPDTLGDLGLPTASEPTVRLSWGETEIPYLPLATDDGWGLFFYAPPLASRYSRRTAFRLEKESAGSRMLSGEAQSAATEPAPARFTLRREEDERYLPQATASMPWFWLPLRAPGETSHTVVLTDAVPGALTLTLDLWSHTSFRPFPDHKAIIRWDGEPVGEWAWNGQGMQTLTATWDETEPGGEHTLTIETPAISEQGVALVWIDSWTLTYPREVGDGLYKAGGNALHLNERGARVLDVSDPFAPLDLGALDGERVIETTPGGRYWVGTPDDAQQPVTVRPAEDVETDLLEGVAYLAIAPESFQPALQPLLDLREEQGLNPTVLTPQAVYDTFGTGRPDPEAIRSLVQSLPELRYLLLMGDATTEPAGYDGEVGALRVVTPFTRTSVLGETPADGWLGTDAQGRPTVAVGRFPVETVAELTVLVEKTVAWERDGVQPLPLLVNDDEAEFRTTIDDVAGLLPGGEEAERIDTGDEDGREALLGALDAAPCLLNYNGHGSLVQLGDEAVIKWDEGATWSQPTVVVAWTCLAAHFTHSRQISMAEAWLRVPEGGAVAFLGPVGETTTFEQRPFIEAFYEALPSKPRLGDAWLQALQLDGGSADVRWGFVILGDPALQVTVE